MTSALATARQGIVRSKHALPRADRAVLRTTTLAMVPVGAILIWALLAIPAVQPLSMNDLGLISVLPVTYFVALGALIVSLSFALHRPEQRPWLVGLHLVALFIILQATVPLIYPEPRYTWTYKHLGVINNIQTYHRLDRSVDLYQNFPGFFAAAAVLSRLSGIAPLELARWAPLFFSGMNVLAVRFALGGLTRNRRQVQLALLVYIVTDWVGQNYLSPQAFAFPLCTVAIALVLRYTANASRRSAEVPYWWSRFLVLGIAAVVVVSHPLTPIMLIAALSALVVVRRCPVWLPVAVTVMLVVQVSLSWHLLSTQFPGLFGTFGNVTQNAAGVGSGIGSTDHAIVVWGTRLLSTLVWFLALAGALVAALRGGLRRVTPPVLLFLTPFVLVFGQSYGGEAIYRVYMFTLPWCAYLISGLLSPADRTRRAVGAAAVTGTPRRQTVRLRQFGTLALGLVLSPLFVLTYFGLDRYAYVRPAAVEMASWFDRNAVPGAVLVGVNSNYPDLIGANYPVHNNVPCCYGITLDESPVVNLAAPSETNVKALVRSLRSYNTPAIYLMITPEEDAYAAILGEGPPGSVAQLGARLAQSPAFRVVFDRDGVALLRLRPSRGAAAVLQ